MKIGQSSSPALSEKRLQKILNTTAQTSDETMTVQGAVNKTSLLLALLIASGAVVWKVVTPENMFAWIIGGVVGGLILAIATIVKPQWSPYTAPLYALVEGVALGAISVAYSYLYDGIVVQAIGLTLGVLFTMLFAYKSGVIKATAKFKKGVIAATGGIALFYIINMIFGFFGGGISLGNMGIFGIGISLFIVVIAALNLVLDFDFIEKSAAYGAPKYMEWYGAFGLMLTLVWLYLEILRLLSLLTGRD